MLPVHFNLVTIFDMRRHQCRMDERTRVWYRETTGSLCVPPKLGYCLGCAHEVIARAGTVGIRSVP